MKKKNLDLEKLSLNKNTISNFKSQNINGGCPATNNSDCVTQVDWVCTHTEPPRCEEGDAQQANVGL